MTMIPRGDTTPTPYTSTSTHDPAKTLCSCEYGMGVVGREWGVPLETAKQMKHREGNSLNCSTTHQAQNWAVCSPCSPRVLQ